MELIQLFDVSAIACPGFAAIQQGCKDYSPVDCDPCCLSYASLAPHPVAQAAKCTASLGQTAGYFFVQGTSGGQATAKVGEVFFILQVSAIYLDRWVWSAGVGSWLVHDLCLPDADCKAKCIC